MNDMITRMHRAKLVPAIISIAFGIALIITRRGAMDVAVKIAAVMLMVAGAGCILMYFFGPAKQDSMQLGIGGIIALGGVLVWVFSKTLVDLFPIFTGISIALNGLSNLTVLSESEGDGVTKVLVFIFSALMIAGGIFIAFHPASVEDTLLLIMGICYILNGVFDLLLMYRVKQILLH